MRFVSVRELRSQSASVWKALSEEKDLVITSNGKPIALLSAIVEEDLEASLGAVRRARPSRCLSPTTSLAASRDRSPLAGRYQCGDQHRTPGTHSMRTVLDSEAKTLRVRKTSRNS